VIAIVPGSSGTDPERIDLEVILGSQHNSSAIVGAVGNAQRG
jgi:hypothetical protein